MALKKVAAPVASPSTAPVQTEIDTTTAAETATATDNGTSRAGKPLGPRFTWNSQLDLALAKIIHAAKSTPAGNISAGELLAAMRAHPLVSQNPEMSEALTEIKLRQRLGKLRNIHAGIPRLRMGSTVGRGNKYSPDIEALEELFGPVPEATDEASA